MYMDSCQQSHSWSSFSSQVLDAIYTTTLLQRLHVSEEESSPSPVVRKPT